MRINTGSFNLVNSLYTQAGRNGRNASGNGGLNNSASGKDQGTVSSGWQQGSANINIDAKTSVRKQMQDQLRNLFEKDQAKNNALFANEQKDALSTDKTEEKKEDKLLDSGNTYNFKEVSNKIMRAKTSSSAGQAVIAAKRKISELKRKLAADANNDDLQLALTHARKMEVVAERKKNNLELEEMAQNTQKRDEQLEKLQDSASSLKNDEIEVLKDKITDEQLENIEEQSEISREEAKKNREEISEKIEQSRELTEQMTESAQELTDEMSDMENEALREMSEMLDTMEVIDPHMSEEELNKLKTKHRLAENKALMKADMDYLKGIFKSLDAKGANGMTTLGQGMSFGGTVSAPSSGMSSGSVGMGFAGGGDMQGAAPVVSVDVSV